jgi:hypothetical protein
MNLIDENDLLCVVLTALIVFLKRPALYMQLALGLTPLPVSELQRREKTNENPAAKKAEASQRRKVISKKRDGVEKTAAIEKALQGL